MHNVHEIWGIKSSTILSVGVPLDFHGHRSGGLCCTWNVFVTILVPPDFISTALRETCAHL